MKSLFEAILLLDSEEEAECFMIDLCTPQELAALKERWRVCQLLNASEHSYREISSVTGASTTTVTRVARFLNKESYAGYKSVLKKIANVKRGKENDQ
ncbi:MAG: trp operon repressor [Holosporales bacterium]|nr:trp operon repressor [Holosporales bacterium]